MRSLAQLHKQDEEWERFVETFVTKVHRGRWAKAEDCWERTVVEFLNTSEMEGRSPWLATDLAQRDAQAILWAAAKWGSCTRCH
ncbi:alpha-beta hydrolase superfamily lysophospholipase [Nonomuraea thailandensis]|uniref:Alpha-beta hydrolase superfamily lysophospholipase n=1 Tax=Nonomuraea thailandensis TaxID=1188745 RepID=A0A9X2GXL9_9ACTN|nr:DUF6313 family protein [Nonomuraea thailandensis]MCP2365757.1 alpha-beta hydrolase superfamily lysophospholipase [Nonomuraea thailandensis]